MEMQIAQIQWRGYRVSGIAPDHILDVQPDAEFPQGRKGLLSAELWRALSARGEAGVLWLDPDIAADLDDLASMRAAVNLSPQDVHTATVKLWPASTGRASWMYGHRLTGTVSELEGQRWCQRPRYWTTSMVWTPSRLLDLALPGLPERPWQGFDLWLNELSLAHDITAWAVHDCRPKHLHF